MLPVKGVFICIFITLSYTVYGDISYKRINNPFEFFSKKYDSVRKLEEESKKLKWMPLMFCTPLLLFLKRITCDGKRDCSDGSDETTTLCQSQICSKNEFRCNYGACISNDDACNGIFDCADGSDEDEINCLKRGCIVPSSNENTKYYIPGCNNCKGGIEVKDNSILQYSCLDDHNYKPLPVKCRNGEWFPYVPICTNANIGEKLQSNKSTFLPQTPYPYNLPISISFIIPGQPSFNETAKTSNRSENMSSEISSSVTTQKTSDNENTKPSSEKKIENNPKTDSLSGSDTNSTPSDKNDITTEKKITKGTLSSDNAVLSGSAKKIHF